MRAQFLLTTLAVFFSAMIFAQQKRVTGTVTNQKTNKPLEGVSIQSQK